MKTENAALRIVNQALKLASRNDVDGATAKLLKAWDLGRSSKKVLTATAGLLVDLGKDDEAIALLQEAAVIHGNSEEIFKIMGEIATRLQLFDMAEKAYSQACALNMSDASNCLNLALSYKQNNKPEEAISLLQSCLELFPDNARMWETLGILLIDTRDDHENGILFLRQAVTLAPKSVTALHNLALKLYFGKEAEELYKAALEVEPENAQVHLSYALQLFAEGRVADAWPHYEYRLSPELGAQNVPHYTHGIPYWKGQSLEGKSILVCAEQGIGDEVLFSTLVPELMKRAEKVFIGCEPRLVSVFERAFEGAVVAPFEDQRNFRSRDRSFPEIESQMGPGKLKIDYSVPMGSLPWLMSKKDGSFLNVDGAFYKPDQALVKRFESRLKKNGKKRIAISWRSGKLSQARRHAYFGTETFERIARCVDAEFYVLQYEYDETERAAMQALPNVTFFDDVDLRQDIEANMAILSLMDMSIGPSTAVQMFAMAAGCPVVMLAKDKPWTMAASSNMGKLYAPGSRFIRFETVDLAEKHLLDILQDEPSSLAHKETEQFNSLVRKPAAWTATEAGKRLRRRRDAIYKAFAQQELERPASVATEKALNGLSSVLLALGPVRNWRDNLSALFATHPQVAVLNMAYQRVRLIEDMDFLDDFSKQRFTSFQKNALVMAQDGTPGDYGGSVLKTRVFHEGPVRAYYTKRFGNSILKPDLNALFWYDPARISSKILGMGSSDLGKLIESGVKFVLPVGNPIECAELCTKSGHSYYLTKKLESSFEEVLHSLLLQYRKLFELNAPVQVFWQHSLSESSLKELCDYSGLEFDEHWCAAMLGLLGSDEYTATEDQLETYRELVEQTFSNFVELKASFLRFAA